MNIDEHETPPTANRRRFPQFSLGTLMLAVLAVAYLCSQFVTTMRQSNWLCETGMTGTTWKMPSGKDGVFVANYAFRFDKLVWVVLESSDSGEVDSVVHSDGTASWIELPSDETVRLPGRGQIYEYSDGRLILHAERRDISRREFSRYINSHPDDFGVDSLVRFVDRRREVENPGAAGE